MLRAMESGEILAALKRLRVPHDAIAAAIGRDRTAATKMLAGRRSIKVTEVGALTALVREHEARQGGPSPVAIATSNHSSKLPVELLPIRFRVQAGAWLQADIYATQDYGEGPIPADPRIPADAQWLEEVQGESMNQVVRHGWLVHVLDPIAVGYQPRDGDLVIIERRRFQGREIERSIKRVHALPGGKWEFRGDSTVPELNEAIRLDDAPDGEVRIAGWVRHAVQRL